MSLRIMGDAIDGRLGHADEAKAVLRGLRDLVAFEGKGSANAIAALPARIVARVLELFAEAAVVRRERSGGRRFIWCRARGR